MAKTLNCCKQAAIPAFAHFQICTFAHFYRQPQSKARQEAATKQAKTGTGVKK
jgi:hypothetical protein